MRGHLYKMALIGCASVLVAAAGGCSPVGTSQEPAAFEFDDATVVVGYDVRDTGELREDDGRPLCRIPLGPCHVERWRDGSAALDFGGGRRVPLEPPEGARPATVVGVTPRFGDPAPRRFVDRLLEDSFGLTVFVFEPFQWLPGWLAQAVHAGGEQPDPNVLALTNYLLETEDPPAGRGRIARSGEATVRVTLTPAGRSKLLKARDRQASTPTVPPG